MSGVGIGRTIYRTDGPPNPMNRSEAAFLGHEGVHGIQVKAHGDLGSFDQAYTKAMNNKGKILKNNILRTNTSVRRIASGLKQDLVPRDSLTPWHVPPVSQPRSC